MCCPVSKVWRVGIALRSLLTFLSIALLSSEVTAQVALPEEVVMVKKPGVLGLELEVTLFKPPGSGPFPVVVINHGKASGDPRFQGRATYPIAVRFFVSRGYLVALPMRQGFSKSSGSYISGGCNVESNGVVQAEDVAATLDYLIAQTPIDKTRILVVGQSHGGLTTMALGAAAYPGVVGLVNFAGGLRQDTCPGWGSVLARTFGNYGKRTKIPSLWFYGDNDSYWPKPTWQAMYANYSEAVSVNGSSARMVAFGTFVTDAHSMFGHQQGQRIWEPEVAKFLEELKLPNEIVHSQFSLAGVRERPPASHFAPLAQIDAVPFLKDSGRKGYEKFLSSAVPRAFALSPSGAWGYAFSNEGSTAQALANCNKNTGKRDCKLYAVDEEVVWVQE
jgi:dienelactone hydrolase